MDFVSALSVFVSEGLECVYGKLSAGKKTKAFMSGLSDEQALRLIQALGECRDRLRNAGKYDDGLSIMEVSALLYTKVFAPVTVTSESVQVLPDRTAAAGVSQLEGGADKFRDRLLAEGKGDITPETEDADDPY